MRAVDVEQQTTSIKNKHKDTSGWALLRCTMLHAVLCKTRRISTTESGESNRQAANIQVFWPRPIPNRIAYFLGFKRRRLEKEMHWDNKEMQGRVPLQASTGP